MQQIVLIVRRAMECLGAMGIAIGSIINVFLVEIQLSEAAIRVGLLMGFVMISTII